MQDISLECKRSIIRGTENGTDRVSAEQMRTSGRDGQESVSSTLGLYTLTIDS